jgi:hypothetical protein
MPYCSDVLQDEMLGGDVILPSSRAKGRGARLTILYKFTREGRAPFPVRRFTRMAVSMNVGPPAASDHPGRAAGQPGRSASLFWYPPHGLAGLRCAVVRRNR